LIEEEGILPSKIVTIYNGIESSKYRAKPNLDVKRQLGIETGSPVVGIIAAFRPQKNHELFLLAAREVLKKNKNVYFLLVGDGIRRRRMEELASELGITKNCLFTGFRKDIPDIISMIDIGVLSSHWEGLPLVVLEYMASSKPVISTNVSGLSEAIHDNINGFLVSPEDHEMLAQRINLLLDNKNLALEMGTNGCSIVREKFTEESMIRRIEALYTEVLAGRN
jgi:Glycosyltransferase